MFKFHSLNDLRYKWKRSSMNNKGYTLIEMLAVVSILGVLTTVAAPSVVGQIERAKHEVCLANCAQQERAYELYLLLENKEHTEAVLSEFLIEQGPTDCGELTFEEGKMQCSACPNNGLEEEQDEEGIPIL